MHRVEVPSPIAPLLLPELRDCVPQPAIVAESEGGYEIEAYEQVVVVVHGVVEAVPRFVGSSLPVKLALEEEFRAELDGTSGALRSLEMTPTEIKNMRANRAGVEGVRWLEETLNREGGAFGTGVVVEDGLLKLRW